MNLRRPLFLAGIIISSILFTKAVSADISVTALVLGSCGNSLIEPLEQCDTNDLASASCQSLGYATGTLSCSQSCSYNISLCESGNSVDWGGGVAITPINNLLMLKGFAYPSGTVSLLNDGTVIATTIADSNAQFQLSATNTQPGFYNFSILAEDTSKIKSPMWTAPLRIGYTDTILISNIFLAPTINANLTHVKQGNTISFYGQTVPFSNLFLSFNTQPQTVRTIKVAQNGHWSYTLNTKDLALGEYQITATAQVNKETSIASKPLRFTVGTENITKSQEVCNEVVDFNHDCKIDLVDFSIAAYWFERNDPPPAIDFNQDGKISLIDFSIIAYYWTGN
ncbi:MAG: hypothetical protein K0S38_124 [Candidatus Paceibacter sp.]|jgi:hypothetical protein|nr:hypothetical protein [Candidatus Paceibacter sp.]